MKISIINISIFLALFFFIASCTDVVDVMTPNGGDRLVVEASILWEKGTSGNAQTIKLSTSSPFFELNSNTPVTGAIVTVTKDDDGTEILFEDQDNGEYRTEEFVPQLNQTYTLEINYNGQIYEAKETLLPVPSIEGFEQTTDGGFGGDEIVVKVLFNDPPNTEDYYLGEFQTSILPLITLESLSDQFTNGNQNFIEYDNENFETGVLVNVDLQGISKRFYNYINLLIEQSQPDDGPFQTVPVKLKGNCINVTTPSEEVLGYFRLSEMVKGQYEIN